MFIPNLSLRISISSLFQIMHDTPVYIVFKRERNRGRSSVQRWRQKSSDRGVGASDRGGGLK